MRFAETAFAWREADRNVHLYNDNLLPKAKALLESALAGYTGGVSGFLDLLEAERTLLDYHVNQAMAVGQRELVLAEMSLIILGRWPEGVRTILPPEQHAGVGSKQQPPFDRRNKKPSAKFPSLYLIMSYAHYFLAISSVLAIV